jgi:hypothetical protein
MQQVEQQVSQAAASQQCLLRALDHMQLALYPVIHNHVGMACRLSVLHVHAQLAISTHVPSTAAAICCLYPVRIIAD